MVKVKLINGLNFLPLLYNKSILQNQTDVSPIIDDFRVIKVLYVRKIRFYIEPLERKSIKDF